MPINDLRPCSTVPRGLADIANRLIGDPQQPLVLLIP